MANVETERLGNLSFSKPSRTFGCIKPLLYSVLLLSMGK